MKIQDDKNINQAMGVDPQKQVDNKDDVFKKVFAEAQSKIGESQEKKPLAAEEISKLSLNLQNASTIARLEASNFSELLGKSNSGEIKKVESFLDLLETYTRALSDPEKNLKDINPLVMSLESEKEKLTALGESLSEGDGLKDIVNQAVIHSTVEILKFNRGDYL
jgi:hypothetical protein